MANICIMLYLSKEPLPPSVHVYVVECLFVCDMHTGAATSITLALLINT